MTHCITQLTLGFFDQKPVVVDFDAPEISSDGGCVLVRQADDKLGVSHAFAGLITDRRDPSRVLHDVQEQARQRIFGIALGYEDCNDFDQLRHDPVIKISCGRNPSDEAGLASQPTLSRFENSVDSTAVRRLIRWFEKSYVDSLPSDTKQVILDIDSTDDETHGGQQLSFFHGYYDHYMYHPLLVFDGESGQLISAMLRPGNTHASSRAAGMINRIIRTIKVRFPDAQILLRGDSGFCVPRILLMLEELDAEFGDIEYLLGIGKNDVLKRLIEPAMQIADDMHRISGKKVRHFTEFEYAAKKWPRKRFVIAKAEITTLGRNPRFILTTLRGFDSELVYDAYCQRGQCENYIKDLKIALQADRLSCSSFKANFFRLLLHCAAYRLMLEIRDRLSETSEKLGRAQFDTIRLRILKIGALVSESVRRIHIRMPKAFPLFAVFQHLVRSLDPPLVHTR